MIRSVYLFIVFIFFAAYSAEAQFWFLGQKAKERYEGMPFKPHSSVSFGAGSSNYIGDLVPAAGLFSVAAQSMRWNLGLQYTRHLSRHFSGNIQVSYIRIAGDDNYFSSTGAFEGNYYRNLHFRNDLKELSVSAVYEPMGNAENLSKRPQLSPYLYLGVAGFTHNPVARQIIVPGITTPTLGSWVDLQGQNTEGAEYSLVNISIPFGFGFRYIAAGPAMQRDHAGLEIHAAGGTTIYPSLNNSPTIAKCLSERVESGKFGMKTGEGFFPWTSETIQAERKRYQDALREGLKIIQKDLPEIK